MFIAFKYLSTELRTMGLLLYTALGFHGHLMKSLGIWLCDLRWWRVRRQICWASNRDYVTRCLGVETDTMESQSKMRQQGSKMAQVLLQPKFTLTYDWFADHWLPIHYQITFAASQFWIWTKTLVAMLPSTSSSCHRLTLHSYECQQTENAITSRHQKGLDFNLL